MSIEISLRRHIGTLDIVADFTSTRGITALFGRSGAGKTSIINMVAGLTKPDSGFIKIGDRTLFESMQGINIPAYQRRVGYVFQEARLFPHLTVRQNLKYGALFSKNRDKHHFSYIVSLLGIDHLLERRPLHLSGGEKQRVAIGRALLSTPDILLMDEPLASLDDIRKNEILPYLERLRDDASIPILYVTHSISEITRLANSVVLVTEGKTIAHGPTTDIFRQPDLLSSALQEDVGASTLIDANISRHDIDDQITILNSPLGELYVPILNISTGRHIRLQIKARDVMLSLSRPIDISALNVVACDIIHLQHDETGMVNVELGCNGASLLARITPKSARVLALAPGKSIYAVIKSVAFDHRLMSMWP